MVIEMVIMEMITRIKMETGQMEMDSNGNGSNGNGNELVETVITEMEIG